MLQMFLLRMETTVRCPKRTFSRPGRSVWSNNGFLRLEKCISATRNLRRRAAQKPPRSRSACIASIVSCSRLALPRFTHSTLTEQAHRLHPICGAGEAGELTCRLPRGLSATSNKAGDWQASTMSTSRMGNSEQGVGRLKPGRKRAVQGNPLAPRGPDGGPRTEGSPPTLRCSRDDLGPDPADRDPAARPPER